MTRVLYIAGLGRSGSTLLTQLLGQIPQLASVGELHHVWQTGVPTASAGERCGCGLTYAECDVFPGAVTRALSKTGLTIEAAQQLRDRVARIRHVRNLEKGGSDAFESAIAQYGVLFARIYSELLEASGAQAVVDASKDLGPAYFLRRVDWLELSIVHLVRDPRGVAHSWSKRKLRPEFVNQEIYMNRHGSFDASFRWWYSNRLADRLNDGSVPFMRLRYEDFVDSPAESVRAISALAGVPEPDLSFLQGRSVELRAASHTVSGNPMRFERRSLEIRADEAWREKMTAPKRWLVGALTAGLRRRYGYRS